MKLDINGIKERNKHRFPFILIDRILELEEGLRCISIKNVSYNEEFFQGHFPQEPVMPGVLVIEALAQTAGIVGAGFGLDPDALLMFAGIDKAKFKLPITPGDQLILKVEFIKKRLSIWLFKGEAYIRELDGTERLAVTAELKIASVSKIKK